MTAVLALCYAGNMIALVAAAVTAAVTATSGLPDREQGLATGLVTMAQQVGITVGIPVLSALGDTGVAVAAGVTLSVAAAAVLGRGARSGGRGSASVHRGPTPPARTSG
ncbi:hypothetical protein GCM10020001_097670 [Nonomuraea salmonea]